MKTPSLESELYTGRFDDGLLDLCVGIGLLGVGAAWLSGLHVYGSILPALLIPLWMLLRRRLTEPRLGRVEFSPARRRSERSWLSASFAAGSGVLALAVAVFLRLRGGDAAPALLPALVPLLPGALLALGLVAVSALIGAPRFAAYALALGGLALVTTWLGGEPGAYMAAGGALLCLWSAGVVARFLSTHPALDGE